MRRIPPRKDRKQTKIPPPQAPKIPVTGEQVAEEEIQGVIEQLRAYAKALPSKEELEGIISGLLSAASKAAIVEALEDFVATEPEGAVELLRHLIYCSDNDIALAAIRGLGMTKSEIAVQELVSFLDSQVPRALRDAARRSLYMLRTSGIDTKAILRAKAAPAELTRPSERPFKALVSHIDGGGNRLIFLGIERPLGTVSSLALLLNDREGITGYDSRDMNRRKFDRLIEERLGAGKEASITWIEIPPEYALYLGKEALDRSTTTVPSLPSFAPWREMLLRQAPKYEHPLIYDELGASQLKWDPASLEKSYELIGLPEFTSWYIPREDTFKEALREYHEAIKSPLALPEGYRETKESKALEVALTKLYGDDYLNILKRRLEEMALVLLRTRRHLHARRALAAALALEQGAAAPLAKHPFVKALVDRSLEWLEKGEGTPKPTIWLPEQPSIGQLPPVLK